MEHPEISPVRIVPGCFGTTWVKSLKSSWLCDDDIPPPFFLHARTNLRKITGGTCGRLALEINELSRYLHVCIGFVFASGFEDSWSHPPCVRLLTGSPILTCSGH